MSLKRALALLPAWGIVIGLSACSKLPQPPVVLQIEAGNGSAEIKFSAPFFDGGTPVESYLVRCASGSEIKTAATRTSPARITGLVNNVAYQCDMRASNSAGTSAASRAFTVTAVADKAHSLAATYKAAPWAKNISVSFPDECNMTLWSDGQPNHPVDSHYLTPPIAAASAIVTRTPLSGIKLALTPYRASVSQEPIVFNVCPTKAATTTATQAGVIGMMVSGASLFASTEIAGHRATVLADNVTHPFRDSAGRQRIARFIDECNGHPNPSKLGSTYHYHGWSECVTHPIDGVEGPSHLIGVALDGFPIYGDRDMHGKPVDLSKLDPCNGITSRTPEFPQGIYHYVLPRGVKGYDSAMRCYAGTVSAKQLAAAQSDAFCYTAEDAPAMATRMPEMQSQTSPTAAPSASTKR